MKITPTSVHPTPNHLVVGCAVELFADGPVRFAACKVPWHLLDATISAWILDQAVKRRDKELGVEEDTPLDFSGLGGI